ncbi:phage portal protein, partial [Nocardiopsis tropica]|uniref:phage portal protein n=1 Tax=Nocardiopsis tropica TaxID=109330 RepID=UPI0031DC2916
MEVSREFFAAPQRYILGASEGAFEDQEGNPLDAWSTYVGRVLGLERDEDGQLPEVGQFAAGDPSAFTRVLDLYARVMATQLSVPPQYLGYTTDNPASADAIRSSESQLVKTAERKQRLFGTPWADVLRLALIWQHGAEGVPAAARAIDIGWMNPATPTVSAQTDAAVKLVTAGIIPADSDVALEMVGLREEQRARVRADRRRSQGRQLLQEIGARAGAEPSQEVVGGGVERGA